MEVAAKQLAQIFRCAVAKRAGFKPAPTNRISSLRTLRCNISNFARLAKIFQESNTLGFGYSRAKTQRRQVRSLVYLPLRLGVFARDIPITFFANFAFFAANSSLWLRLCRARVFEVKSSSAFYADDATCCCLRANIQKLVTSGDITAIIMIAIAAASPSPPPCHWPQI